MYAVGVTAGGFLRVFQCSGHSTRCFSTGAAPRRSNESQLSMLQTPAPLPPRHKKHKSSSGAASSGAAGRSHKSRKGGGELGGLSQHHKKLRFALAKERKASTTLGIIMSAFTICWLPFFVLALIRPFLHDRSSSIPSWLSSLFLWLGYANSLLNPIIYATLNRDFRRPFQQILYFRCGSLNHMMREEFYHSQYGDPDHQQYYGAHPGDAGAYEEAEVTRVAAVDDEEDAAPEAVGETRHIRADESFLIFASPSGPAEFVRIGQTDNFGGLSSARVLRPDSSAAEGSSLPASPGATDATRRDATDCGEFERSNTQTENERRKDCSHSCLQWTLDAGPHSHVSCLEREGLRLLFAVLVGLGQSTLYNCTVLQQEVDSSAIKLTTRRAYFCQWSLPSCVLPLGGLSRGNTDPDKLEVQNMYSGFTFAIGSQIIRHTLEDSEPIADLQ
ncbi:hypothetical protein PR048_033314 [Dryococelus australis]|uniref:G-protein coupled receptors family 1 profile domain-containing protein n=1 Tax=Dryococelus australis TaxID=614101 RepID=A0ABQ9FZX9_9NEOP|nr:hypothetical protein PR048_033314 [Dryococelus australis]